MTLEGAWYETTVLFFSLAYPIGEMLLVIANDFHVLWFLYHTLHPASIILTYTYYLHECSTVCKADKAEIMLT